jgi:protoporphyrin/coproporphyrin ferrochelatase
MAFADEPAHQHGKPPQTGILLANLGTPDAPTPSAVRRYLAEFLSDPRVVEIPPLLWMPILHGIVLRVRPARSAAKYASIWTADGSPLLVWSEKLAKLLTGYLGERGHRVVVRAAMRYGNPSIASRLDALKAEGCRHVLVLPLYPQYAGPTTASVFDAVYDWARRARSVPEFRFVNRYHDDAGYIDALAASVHAHWQREGQGERLVLSFHGVPERTLRLGDAYHCECRKTARLLGERLRVAPERLLVTFQSRFGRAEWLEPYTEPTLRELAASGVKSVDVMCPGFATDCLETLEEIDQEARAAFLASGGEAFRYIACLNDRHEWVDALAAVAIRHLHGWPAGMVDAAEWARSRERALALGAAV